MPPLSINNRLLSTSMNYYKYIFFGLIVIIYFTWMDIALFVHLQRWSPPPIEYSSSPSITDSSGNVFDDLKKGDLNSINGNQASRIKQLNNVDPFTVFKPLSVKLIMIDHPTHYIHDILARFLEDTLHFTRIFPWVSANLVSFAGLFSALVGSKLMVSDNLVNRQFGAFLFELRNLADSLDGVVFRSKKREQERLKSLQGESTNNPQVSIYQSVYGSFGYNVDVICDGLGGLFLILAIFIRFLRHPPHKNSNSKLLLTSCTPDNHPHYNHLNSNYNYHQLKNNDEEGEKLDSLEMDYVNCDPNLKSDSNEKLSLSVEKHGLNSRQLIDVNNKCCNRDEQVVIKLNSASISAFANNDDDNSSNSTCGHVSSRQIKLVVISFGIRLLFTGLIWDHYVHKYHDLLMVFSSNPTQRRMQGQAFKSIGMWLIMWFWRLGNACAMLEHLVISTVIDKLWEYLLFSCYIGWAFLVVLTLFTQIHYTELYESLNSLAAYT